MQQVLVSVIVPVYNVEKFLDYCIKSIMGQSYKFLEIILVDDGSPDECPRICDEYARKDSRIKVIHKQNGGLSSARNAGMATATGEFIFHVDGDDTIPHDAIKLLLEKQREGGYDLVFGDFANAYEDRSEIVYRPIPADKTRFIENICSDLCFPHFIWGVLIKKTLYTNYGIGPIDGINVGEDLQVLPQLVYHAKSYAKLDKRVYNYNRTNAGSLTAGFSYSRILQDLSSINIVRDFFARHGEKNFVDCVLSAKVQYIHNCKITLAFSGQPWSKDSTLSSLLQMEELRPYYGVLPKTSRILMFINSPAIVRLYVKLVRIGGICMREYRKLLRI